MRPQGDLVATPARKAQCNGGAPGPAAHHGDPAHAAAFALPKRYSVPCSSRPMFWWCLAITIAGIRKVTAVSHAPYVAWRNSSAKTGNAAAARIDASET